MAGESLNERPPRGVLRNVETGRALEFQYNPESIKEKLEAVYVDLAVLGLPHEPDMYDHTKSLAIGPLELNFDAMGIEGTTVHEKRLFLHSLMYPRRGADDVTGGGPPRVLFIWPNLYSIVCRVRSLEIEFLRFFNDMRPALFKATITLVESRLVRLASEDVLNNGTLRS